MVAQGYAARSHASGSDGVSAFKEDEFSLVITDVRLPDMTGIDVLKRIKEIDGNTPVIVMTAFGTIRDAVEAMKFGAFDYITKPFSLDEFSLVVKRAIEFRELAEENIRLRQDLSEYSCYLNMIGESAAMRKVYGLIEKVSRTRHGKGTGCIHHSLSERARQQAADKGELRGLPGASRRERTLRL
jgi:DNA-binding NtrC family response regulator